MGRARRPRGVTVPFRLLPPTRTLGSNLMSGKTTPRQPRTPAHTSDVRPEFLPFPGEALHEVPPVHAALRITRDSLTRISRPQSQDTGIPHLTFLPSCPPNPASASARQTPLHPPPHPLLLPHPLSYADQVSSALHFLLLTTSLAGLDVLVCVDCYAISLASPPITPLIPPGPSALPLSSE